MEFPSVHITFLVAVISRYKIADVCILEVMLNPSTWAHDAPVIVIVIHDFRRLSLGANLVDRSPPTRHTEAVVWSRGTGGPARNNFLDPQIVEFEENDATSAESSVQVLVCIFMFFLRLI